MKSQNPSRSPTNIDTRDSKGYHVGHLVRIVHNNRGRLAIIAKLEEKRTTKLLK